jgi:hypothetical protein
MSNRNKMQHDADYWLQMRRSYIEKNNILFSRGADADGGRYYYCDFATFYRFIFPEGFLECPGAQVDWTEPGGGHPNAIVIEITNDTKTVTTKKGDEVERPVVRRYMLTDDLDGIHSCGRGELGELENLVDRSIAMNTTMFVAPVSYFGKERYARNARFLHAFTVDLDGVGVEQLRNLLKQIDNGHGGRVMSRSALPQPSAIVNSGTGMHLYYVLDHPIPLVPKVIPFLQEVKRLLIDHIWNAFTSTIEERQYQGIFQSFRMVGTPTKLNGHGEDAKRDGKYETVAFRYEQPVGNPWRVSLDYLIDYIGIATNKKTVDALEVLRKTGGRTPIEKAKELWPEWYERRVVNGAPRGRWTANRAVYDWWLGLISDTSNVTYHHRYWCIRELAAYADKCGVSEEELEEDAYSLVELYDKLTESPDNHFTADDVAAALDGYGDGVIHRHSTDGIRRRTQIQFQDNKRNGRKQAQHMAVMRAIQAVTDPDGSWRNMSGRPVGSGTKKDVVQNFAREHPDMSHAQMARELGVSRPTVIKWLKEVEEKRDVE